MHDLLYTLMHGKGDGEVFYADLYRYVVGHFVGKIHQHRTAVPGKGQKEIFCKPHLEELMNGAFLIMTGAYELRCIMDVLPIR